MAVPAGNRNTALEPGFRRLNNTAGHCMPGGDQRLLSNSGGMRQLSVGARLVDGVRKLLRQDLGDLIDGNIVPGGKLPDRVATQTPVAVAPR